MKIFVTTASSLLLAMSLSSFADSKVKSNDSAADCTPQHHEWHDRKSDDGGMSHGKKWDDGPKHMEKTLGLSDTQKKALADARAKAEPEHKALFEKIHAAHDALRKADDEQADDAALTMLANNLANLMAQQEVMHVKEHRAFVAQLTAEQKQILAQWKKDHPMIDRMDHRHP